MDVQYADTRGEGVLAPRVSWGAVVGGAVFALTVTTVLYILGMAITFLATGVTSLGNGFIALGVILIVATIAGNALGGVIAGATSGGGPVGTASESGGARGLVAGGARRSGALHGLLASAVAFLTATFFCMLILWKLIGAAGSAVASTAQTAAQAGSATAATAAQGGNVAGNMERLLQSLGYSASEARQLVVEGQRSVQRVLRRNNVPTGAEVQQQAISAGNSLLHGFGGTVGIYFLTWLISMLAAAAGGSTGAARSWLGSPTGRREALPTERTVVTPSHGITPPYPTGA